MEKGVCGISDVIVDCAQMENGPRTTALQALQALQGKGLGGTSSRQRTCLFLQVLQLHPQENGNEVLTKVST